jgi:hypothetical protein
MADADATELQGNGTACVGRREERKRRKRAQNFSGEGKHSEEKSKRTRKRKSNDGVQESSPFFKKQFDRSQRADRTLSTSMTTVVFSRATLRVRARTPADVTSLS